MSFAKIRPRRGTANQWSNANPILAEGEIGIEVPSTGVGTGTVKIKFGDGSSHWNDLPYGLDTPNISNVISNEFIVGTPCTSGNYYIANHKLYKCIADTDGSINVTNSNYFEETSVADEVKTLNGRFMQMTTEPYTAYNSKSVQANANHQILSYNIPEDGVYDVISNMLVNISSESYYNNAIYINADDSATEYEDGIITRSSMHNGGGNVAYMIRRFKKGDTVKVFTYVTVACEVRAKITVARRF